MLAAVSSPALSRARVAPAPRRALVIQAAQKKGQGSTKNGRDSNAKRRGVKVYGGQPVKAGGIIVRQVGSTVSQAARRRREFGICGLRLRAPAALAGSPNVDASWPQGCRSR
jgi:hypothetical protein